MAWTLPPASAIAFAARVRQAKALEWGISISVLLIAILLWFVSWDVSELVSRCFAVTAVLVVIAGLCLSYSSLGVRRAIVIANLTGIFLLFIPSAIALMRSPKIPSEPARVWTTVLQPQDWYQDAMNTGSEYAATRQVVFAGDRVVALFDAGQAPHQGDQPMSNYRIVSLDARTGKKKNEIDFVGRWANMPYIYAARDGQIDVQSNPPRVLNPDLTDAPPISSAVREEQRVVAARQGSSGAFDPTRWLLGGHRILRIEGDEFQELDQVGKTLTKGKMVESGGYAGASQDGTRFAIESSYPEGDPMFLAYEYFTIYSSDTGAAVATVWVKDLPEMHSWCALSPDGRYFITGKPGAMTMYSLP